MYVVQVAGSYFIIDEPHVSQRLKANCELFQYSVSAFCNWPLIGPIDAEEAGRLPPVSVRSPIESLTIHHDVD